MQGELKTNAAAGHVSQGLVGGADRVPPSPVMQDSRLNILITNLADRIGTIEDINRRFESKIATLVGYQNEAAKDPQPPSRDGSLCQLEDQIDRLSAVMNEFNNNVSMLSEQV